MDRINLHPKWKNLFNDTRYFICTGGRGSSKSFSIQYFLTMLIAQESGHTVIFARMTKEAAGKSIIPGFRSMIDRIADDVEGFDSEDMWHFTRDEIINKRTGSKIWFVGLEASKLTQTAKLKGWDSASTFVLDEAEELTEEDAFDKINNTIRLKGKQNRIILLLNPATRTHFVYTRFFLDKWQEGKTGVKDKTTYIHTTYLDNIDNLDGDVVEEWEQAKIDRPDYYKHIIEGGWKAVADGVVYTNWKCEKGVTEWEEHEAAIGCLDFGFKHPTAMNVISLDRDGKRVYARCVCHKSGMTASDTVDFIKGLGLERLLWVCDNARPEIIEDFSRAGIKVIGANKTAGTVDDGIAMLQDLEIFVDPHELNKNHHTYKQPLVVELQNYVWDDKVKEQVVKEYDDALDALRYGVYYLIGTKYTSTKQRKAVY